MVIYSTAHQRTQHTICSALGLLESGSLISQRAMFHGRGHTRRIIMGTERKITSGQSRSLDLCSYSAIFASVNCDKPSRSVTVTGFGIRADLSKRSLSARTCKYSVQTFPGSSHFTVPPQSLTVTRTHVLMIVPCVKPWMCVELDTFYTFALALCLCLSGGKKPCQLFSIRLDCSFEKINRYFSQCQPSSSCIRLSAQPVNAEKPHITRQA